MVSYTKEELILQLQNLAKELGRTPTFPEFNKCRRTSNSTVVVRRFGSWNNGLQAAGLKINKVHRPFSDEELILQLQNLAKELGKTPTMKEFDSCKSAATKSTIINHFGSWSNGLKKAGLKTNRVTQEELIRQIKELCLKLGHTPTSEEFDKSPETSSLRIIYGYFNSWSDLLESAGIEKRQYCNKEIKNA